eukprot:9591662-Ditylum_brightwellii.AAC.1
MQSMSSYSMSYCNGNSPSMKPCSKEAHLSNNISSEQLEATKKQVRYVVDEYEVKLKEVDNGLSLSSLVDCKMHDDRDMSVEIADFNTSKSSASHLLLNSAEMITMNESAMSESKCSFLHQTNSICRVTLSAMLSHFCCVRELSH